MGSNLSNCNSHFTVICLQAVALNRSMLHVTPRIGHNTKTLSPEKITAFPLL